MGFVTLLVSFLKPFLPYLLNLGKPVAETAGKKLGEKLGEGSWDKAQQLWGRLLPKVAEKPLAQGAVQALAENAEDDEAKDILSKQLQKLFEANPDLAQQIQQMVSSDQDMIANAVTITQNVQGNQNIVIGEASGSVNIRQG
jgi:hypothetical protein